jgi:hypothetical protein
MNGLIRKRPYTPFLVVGSGSRSTSSVAGDKMAAPHKTSRAFLKYVLLRFNCKITRCDNDRALNINIDSEDLLHWQATTSLAQLHCLLTAG